MAEIPFKQFSRENLVALQKKVKQDLKIDSTDLLRETVEHLGTHAYYLTIYDQERRKLWQLRQIADKKWSELFFAYRLGNKNVNSEGVLLTHTKEIELAVKKDTVWINMKGYVDWQESIVHYLEHVMRLFSDRKWLLKDAKDLVNMDRDTV